MNELQAVQLDMLKTFWEICDRLELHPYLISGSALGAVKYRGFVPWDDDVDVALIRPEYERFLQEAPALLPDALFLQNARTDPAFAQLYSKLRKNATSFVEERAAHLPIHHGVFIDLFPLDSMPSGRLAAWKVLTRVRLCRIRLLCAFGAGDKRKERLLRRFGRMLGWHRHTERCIRRTEAAITQMPFSCTGRWCCYGNWRVRSDCAPAAQYGEGAPAVFEGLQVRIPAQYETYLSQRYGNWRADLPPEQRHGRRAQIDLRSDHWWRKP